MSSRARVPTALITASLPGPAADGLPAGVDATPVSAPGGAVEYTTKSLRRGALVLARERSSGRLLRKTRLRGSWAVPAVAYGRVGERPLGRWPHAGTDQPAQALSPCSDELRDPRSRAGAPAPGSAPARRLQLPTSFVVTDRTERAKEAHPDSRRTGTPWLLLSVAASALVLAIVLRLVRKPVSPAQT